MLLTGFDAPRLKKIYLGRVIKAHNLLQTLTRVNRPYKNFKYGYVVDFADIREEYDRTNAAYFNELQQQLGEDFKTYSNIFLSQEEIDMLFGMVKKGSKADRIAVYRAKQKLRQLKAKAYGTEGDDLARELDGEVRQILKEKR